VGDGPKRRKNLLLACAFYGIGGRISRDFTGGYGPEEFLLKRAMPGKYKIQVDYYGSSRQTVSGPTTVQAKLISNFGRKSEKCKEVTIRSKNSQRSD
jgi:Ca-activated chloride channel family protein